MINKRFIMMAAVLAMVIGITVIAAGCGSAGDEKAADQEKAAAEESVAEEAWADAYIKVLQDNGEAIRAYELGYYGEKQKPGTALCDLNGDGIPELLFFTQQSEDYAGLCELSIYTFDGKNARKVDYTCSSASGEDKGEEKRPYYDAQVAGGTVYIIYTEKETGHFNIYSTITDESIMVQMNRYSMDKKGSISEIQRLGYRFSFVEYDGNTYVGSRDKVDYKDAEMYIDGAKASEEEYLKAYDAARDAMNEVIFCSDNGYRGDDEAIWEEAGQKQSLALYYNDLLKKMGYDPEQENGAIMEKVLKAYGEENYDKAEEYNAKLPKYAYDMPVSDEEKAAYDHVFETLSEEGKVQDEYIFHCICDVDQDGRGEYLIQTGTCEADYMLQCYKYEDGKAKLIGEVGSGHTSVHQYPGHKGIILEYGHMGGEALTVVTFGEGEPKYTQIGGRSELSDVEDYIQLGLMYNTTN